MFQKKWIYLISPALLGVLILIVYITINYRNRPESPPVSFVYLNDQTLQFRCINSTLCYHDIDLDSYFQVKNTSSHPIVVNNGYYVNPSSIYITLQGSGYASLINVNPISEQIKYNELPNRSDLSLMVYTNDKVVIGTRNGDVYIYQNNILTKNLHLELHGDNAPAVEHLISVDNNTIIAVNGCPIISQGKTYAEVFSIDIEKGIINKNLLPVPNFESLSQGKEPLQGKKYALRIDTVSKDLSSIYYFYLTKGIDNSTSITLGKYFTTSSTDGPSINKVDCINWMSGYYQYHDFLYSSKINIESGANATLIDMGSLNSISKISEISQNEPSGRMIVVPFGDNFLLGTDQNLFILSMAGEIINKYPLPQELVNKNYSLIEYRN